jgi:hypothetical protein
MEFEPTIPAGERPQNYVIDRAATGTGAFVIILFKCVEIKIIFLYVVWSLTSAWQLWVRKIFLVMQYRVLPRVMMETVNIALLPLLVDQTDGRGIALLFP